LSAVINAAAAAHIAPNNIGQEFWHIESTSAA
jgi:hypothetical protein